MTRCQASLSTFVPRTRLRPSPPNIATNRTSTNRPSHGLNQGKPSCTKLRYRTYELIDPRLQMYARAAARTTTSLVTRRGFHATRARLSSPYHYPEGPYTNIPFNPRTKWFGVKYWGTVAIGFFTPFGIACASFIARSLFSRFSRLHCCRGFLLWLTLFCRLPGGQGPVSSPWKDAGCSAQALADWVVYNTRIDISRTHRKVSFVTPKSITYI